MNSNSLRCQFNRDWVPHRFFIGFADFVGCMTDFFPAQLAGPASDFCSVNCFAAEDALQLLKRLRNVVLGMDASSSLLPSPDNISGNIEFLNCKPNSLLEFHAKKLSLALTHTLLCLAGARLRQLHRLE